MTTVDLNRLATRLRDRLGPGAVLTDRNEVDTYACDGLTHYRATPGLVVLAGRSEDVGVAVEECAAAGVPFVARGSGTGLSGGALPRADGVLIVTSRLRAVVEIDVANRRAVLEPGVANLDVTRRVAPSGHFYAPDPSSQQVCSIGGNVAENSGGAHCLKYGFTTNHVTGLDVVTSDGETITLGAGKALDAPGYDLLGAFIGSEGTLGVATSVTVRLTRSPESVRTLLAGFASTDDAGAAVSAIVGAGVVPAAVEMMDALAIEAAEAAAAEQLCRDHGATEVRVAVDDDERARIWRGRKSAFAAVGRISPDYIVQDGVIPRTALSEVLQRITALASERGLRVANVFHAGDGNLHPLVLFDEQSIGEAERAEELSAAILDVCLEYGGSITGEHGVGTDKVAHMPRMFSEADLDTMQILRCAFDPDGLSNPGKVFPTPRLCGEVPGRRRGVHPLQEAGLAEVF